MKKELIYDLWMMMLGWSLFLIGYGMLGIIVVMSTNIYLFIRSRINNVWRFLSIFLLSFSLVYFTNSISNYYPLIALFLMAVCINVALTLELLIKIDNQYIFPIYIVSWFVFFTFFLTSILIPDYLYSFFGKQNLYIMIMLIFIPYTFLMTGVIAYKVYVKRKAMINVKNKELLMK